MPHDLDIGKLHAKLAASWGAEALLLDEQAGKIYFHFAGEVSTAHMIDVRLGTVQCYAEVPVGLLRKTDSPAGLCEFANELNIAIARDLGLSLSFHVIGHALHLCDLRGLDSDDRVDGICVEQAEEVSAALAALLSQMSETSAPDAGDRLESASFA